MTSPSRVRSDLVDFLERDLIGPAGGAHEILDDSPRIRYLAVLPQGLERNESEAAGGTEGETSTNPLEEEADVAETDGDSDHENPRGGGATPEAEYDDALTLANTYRPSALGLSFFVRAGVQRLTVSARAGVYESKTHSVENRSSPVTRWHRVPIDILKISIELSGELPAHADWKLADGLTLRGVFRRRDQGQLLVTLSLFNTTKEFSRDALTYYQCGFTVVGDAADAAFVEYRSPTEAFEDAEDAALALVYRKRRTFAVGHGCAAVWRKERDDGALEIATTAIPRVTVPPVNPVSLNASYLDMQFLSGSDGGTDESISQALMRLCDHYEEWITARSREIAELGSYEPAPTKNLESCRVAHARMRRGIALLESDPRALEAFTLMNRVMLMQQRHSRLRRKLDEPWEPLPTEYASNWEKNLGFWRTFQIAFILMNLDGLNSDSTRVEIDGESVPERDLVDLIWFPTGGGKTEAYLGLAAFLIFRRRLENPSDEGCKIVMRYTLRLLTSQQFQRAASLICACEIVRRTDPYRFGKAPLTIGLYVGLSLTPNTEADALKAIARMSRKGRSEKNPFQLLQCPWCGTELDNDHRLGYADRRGRMIFICPSSPGAESGCPFSDHAGHLPISVVDETIYKQPPTLLIATVDKFAMMAWREEAGRILTYGGGPELFIQDELHLIAGPLGSMVGLYEGVFEYLASMGGRKPKIVASTATIRRADEQCQALYGRGMFQFPPPGLDASDSYFAKEDRDAPGRVYVGFLPTAASSPLTAQIRTIVSMQQGVLLVTDQKTEDQTIDPYWTLVQYFGSLKELGRAATFVTADIPEFLPTMHRRYNVPPERKRWMRHSEELTSRKNESEIPQILKRLETPYSRSSGREQALDTLLATNMISVGVDVDRLGLMLIVTQPKGTSEYIQASSRVGRSARAPGLVFTLYNAGRPRDRSHYERFSGYHEAYYRFVEPTSVTPFSPPAMKRALHAVLVIAGRHIAGFDQPSDFRREESRFRDFLAFLRERVTRIDRDHLREFDELVEARLYEWESGQPSHWGGFGDAPDGRPLMRPAGRPPRDNEGDDCWETPTSMRTVDVECSASVLSRFPDTALEQDLPDG